MRSHRFCFTAVCIATIASTVARTTIAAHEIGTTRVSVVLDAAGGYRAEIVTDAAALLDKLTTVTGQSAPASLSPEEARARLMRFDDTFRTRLTLAFDSRGVRPAIAYDVAAANGTLSATIRLSG